ncbi:MAG: kelch repeat-containing protein, partial [Bryobacteraceae bacterium]|nr:kelch repeat-containing protein [Bryobacteraceae bacterium]
GTRPLRRCLHHAVLDAYRDTMYLFGGCASGFGPCPLNDLWAFDLAANRWTEVTGAAKPPAREHYGRVFDSARRRLVLYGGSGAGLLGDTWEFDPQSSAWGTPNVRGETPAARSRHESAYAVDRAAAFFFGGRKASGLTNELWMLASAGPRVSGVGDAFTGAGGAVAPGHLVSIFGSGLGPVDGRSFDFDAASGLLPTSGAGASAAWNGVASPLYFARADQLNVQVPYELAGQSSASLVVTVDGVAGAPMEIRVAPTAVGLFPGAWNQDGRRNSAAAPARAGEIVVMFATGQGVTVPASVTGAPPVNGFPEPAAPVSVTIGGMPAEVLFRGQAPGTAGVMQINARIPAGVAAGEAVAVTLTVGDSRGETAIAVRF